MLYIVDRLINEFRDREMRNSSQVGEGERGRGGEGGREGGGSLATLFNSQKKSPNSVFAE